MGEWESASCGIAHLTWMEIACIAFVPLLSLGAIASVMCVVRNFLDLREILFTIARQLGKFVVCADSIRRAKIDCSVRSEGAHCELSVCMKEAGQPTTDASVENIGNAGV